tara:strand:- start:12259 stop:14361 length:2103 start_codon:yes stop_codon:yes gene_type:complete
MKIKIIKSISFLFVLSPLLFYFLINLLIPAPQSSFIDESNEIFFENEFEPCRFDKFDFQNFNNEKRIINFYKNDLSVIPEYKQIVCLGKVNNYKLNQDYINLEYGTNPIFNIILVTSTLTFLLIAQIRFKIFKNRTYVFLNFIFSFIFELFLQPVLNVSSIISRVIIFLFIFYLYQNNFSISSDEINYDNNSFLNYSIITVIGALFAFFGNHILKDNYIGNDQFLNLIAAKRILYLDYTNFQSTWNQHSALIPDLYKFTFFEFPTSDYQSNFFILFVITITLTTINFYKILNKLNISSQNNLVYCLAFFTICISLNMGNRLVGMLFMSFIIVNLLNFINSKKSTTLFLLIFLSFVQIYNMESYGLALIAIFIYLITISDNKSLFTFQSLIFSIISFIAIFSREIINGELLVLFKTNYLFHIFNTKSVFTDLFGQRLVALYESFTYPFERGSNFGLTMYLLAIAFAVYIIFYSKNFNNKYKVISYILIFELFHLILTGPRFSHYAEVILLPSTILFFLFIDSQVGLSKIDNKNIYIMGLILISLSASTTSIERIKEMVYSQNFRETSIILSNEKVNEDLEVKKIIDILDSDSSENLIVFWTNQADWYWIVDNGNVLPSTRMWWWLKMRYVDIEKYDWSRNWNQKEFETIYINDIEKEKPRLILIDKTYKPVPDILENIINETYFSILETEKYLMFQNINQQ